MRAERETPASAGQPVAQVTDRAGTPFGVAHSVVLNVDDYEAGRYATSRILRQAGFEVVEAANGMQALDLAHSELPDIVVLDVNLPDIDGFEVCRRLKDSAETADIPVLYLSAAYRQAEHRVQGLELGADAYLTQPTDPRELVATVNALLRARSVREAVRRSEERFRAFVEAMARVVWTTSPEGEFVGEQPGWSEFTGQSREELQGTGWLEAVHPEDRDATLAAWRMAVASRSSFLDEHRLRNADGEYRVMLARAVPVVAADGSVREWVGAHTDITERRTMEDALRRGEARLRRIIEGNVIGIVFFEPEGRVIDANDAFLELTGYTRDQLEGEGISWQAITPPGFADADRKAMEELRRSGHFAPFEKELIRDDGSRLPVMIGGALVENTAGECVAFVLDLTERRWAEDAQRFLVDAGRIFASSLDYQTTLESVAHFAVPLLADTCIVHVVDETGAVNKVVRVHRAARTQPAEGGAAESAIREHAMGAIRTGETAFLADAASVGAAALISIPLRARGRTLGAISFAMDESERRYSPADLALAQELASRAALAMDNARLYKEAQQANQAKSDFMAVTSHELRTPMNAVLGYVDLLSMGIGGTLTELQREQIDRIGQSARHLMSIIEEILTFSRMEAGNLEIHVESADLGELVGDVAALVEPLARKANLDFRVQLPDASVAIETDPHKVRQILFNLVGNAIKFTERGEVDLSVTIEGEMVSLAVRDTGIGIPPEHIDKIFDPFWQVNQRMTRTKGGTGLGLTVTRQLVELIGGTISVESQPGVGSTFEVRLPMHGITHRENDD